MDVTRNRSIVVLMKLNVTLLARTIGLYRGLNYFTPHTQWFGDRSWFRDHSLKFQVYQRALLFCIYYICSPLVGLQRAVSSSRSNNISK